MIAAAAMVAAAACLVAAFAIVRARSIGSSAQGGVRSPGQITAATGVNPSPYPSNTSFSGLFLRLALGFFFVEQRRESAPPHRWSSPIQTGTGSGFECKRIVPCRSSLRWPPNFVATMQSATVESADAALSGIYRFPYGQSQEVTIASIRQIFASETECLIHQSQSFGIVCAVDERPINVG